MQEDMHFYGTYALAKAAGIEKSSAKEIAYAAQFVDDSTKCDSDWHSDGSLLYGIATAHSNGQCVKNVVSNAGDHQKMTEEQRRVWVPFHFLPGAKGSTFDEKLVCQKNSSVAQEMMMHHVHNGEGKSFYKELLGIAAHVYLDTFSHYGFSGISSDLNSIKDSSLNALDVKNTEMKDYILGKKERFFTKYRKGGVVSFFAEKATASLGHGAVATYPDRPFLKWEFEYEKTHGGVKKVEHNNQEDFYEGSEQLYKYFSSVKLAELTDGGVVTDFSDIADKIREILALEGDREARIKAWKDSGLVEQDVVYDASDWEKSKNDFPSLEHSEEVVNTSVYKFHQAAAYHRCYVLKELLSQHGVVVY
ncbi:DUF6765 family protein [Desulfobaculum bizertense]|uniref:Uncharacterized protein n=1 Tax=Desulfobaculum bizertense DSM 18034 TaxID=1121442 RepID=A0A1T4VSI7_9BACT|nr:DUF6765 family protein [Desulfobaculum bizertense]SKA67933.1 hypothetical protein SAMN02745702_00919 [Desulfobaculum bizertense DSM 18034]